MSARYWCSGAPTPLDDAEWARIVPSFLGAGFRIRVPSGAAVDHARAQARAVAALLGTAFDETPWSDLPDGAHEIAGGWVYGLTRSWGPAWTAVTPVATPAAATRAAVDLPWLWSSTAPTAGLPMISALEAELAEQFAGDRVGLWWDHRDLLCATTAGPPLVLADGAWHSADPASGAVRSWAYDEAARRLGAVTAPLTRDLLAAADAVVAVCDLGVETHLDLTSHRP